LTATRYGKALAAGATTQIPYNFYSEYAPGELGLTVYVDLLVQVSRKKKACEFVVTYQHLKT
jgi:hypothetical protein